ncbi:MAG: hypothetical protein DRJ49_00320 [Thermoprotei archaeon]|nr:MAG: hypothetical protein DRN53_01495 [Thermoprotei archaeon]RLE90286.1 MAG: hypothetical protein DRJ49_00320 [Thermoprotei archaeon]
MRVVRLVIDALKPREFSIVELARMLCSLEGVEEVNISVREVDVKTETIRITVEGRELDIESINALLNDGGIAVRSIDEVSAKSTEH